MDEMPISDLNDLIIGIKYKNRQQWEMVRINSYLTMAPHCKKLDIKKVLPFSWDRTETKDTSISNEDVKKLQDLSKKFENLI